jgi:ATP-dependent DNA helicase RecG
MLTLKSKLNELYGVGERLGNVLSKLGIHTIEDLLFYWPFRYDDFSQIKKIADLKDGESVNIVGEIELIQNKKSFKKRMNITEALIKDDTETIKAIWFNQPFIIKNLKVGDYVSLAGKVIDDSYGIIMQSPVYEKISNADQNGFNADSREYSIHTQGLIPNYHLSSNITQKQLRYFIKQIINLAENIPDWLPKEIIKKKGLLSLGEAIKQIHFPVKAEDINEARKRLGFNELFLLQLQAQIIKKQTEDIKAEPIKFFEKETKEFVDSLPFKLTDAQRKASWEIIKDLGKDKPMTRLLEGDVGSGKTLVAVIAMLNASLNGKQAVLMVPTEILARQHYETVCKLLLDFPITVGLVTRSEKTLNNESGILNQEKKQNLKTHDSLFIIQNSQIIIGTHSLIQESVEFNNLALVIIDEQHRFGVEQRKLLLEKNSSYTKSAPFAGVATEAEPAGNQKSKIENLKSPHLLSMTATPIPRSLALALYGDLDISIINEMPKNRKKIITRIVEETNRSKAYEFIYKQILEGRQVFVVCPLIDPSDKLGVKAVKDEHKKLNEQVFPDLEVGLLHGKMKSKEKEEVMKNFLDKKIKILVSTSVIEVGVDVPNATIIMIEGADRFGLAQLHQFRGRVGRGEHQSYCFLFTDNNSPNTLNRLNALTKYDNGFDLAKIDLKYRGPGEVYGTSQAGFPELKIASLFDYALMKEAQAEAIALIEKDKDLNNWPILKEKLNKLNSNTHLE